MRQMPTTLTRLAVLLTCALLSLADRVTAADSDSGSVDQSIATGDAMIWSNQDIGSVGAAGSSTQTRNPDGTVTLTVKGAGADVWGTADAFQFTYQSLTGNGTITGRVVSQTPTDNWAKAGVMIRETLDSNSVHAFVAVTPANGVVLQRRTVKGGSSVNTSGPLTAAPYWVRLNRSGNTFTAYASVNGTTWTQIGQSTVSMAATVFIGLAVTSHRVGVLSTATFSNVTVSSPPAGAWSNHDVGSVGAAGSSTQTTNPDGTATFTVKGSGADIWGTADAFQFTYQSLTGNGTITARVVDQSPTDNWAKAGVMIRETLDANSVHAFVAVTPANGIAFQRRTVKGGSSVNTPGPLTAAPYWVRLNRSGNIFSAYASADGATWTFVGQNTVSMAATVFVGLAVSSHHAGVLSSATFSNVSVTSPPPGVWSNRDVGSVGAAGSSTQTKDPDGTVTFTVKGSGADVWGTADAFQFNYQSLTGNGTITARVASQTPTDNWAKAGVMIRETLDSNSVHAFVAVTPVNGISFLRRNARGGRTVNTLGPLTPAPYWVRLNRTGNTFSAYASADGTTWTPVGQDTLSMAATVFVGLAVTSHHAGILSTATYDNVAGPLTSITGVQFDWTSHRRLAPGSDNWPTTWSNDDNQYAIWGDGGGFGGTDSDGRSSLGVARIVGNNTDYQGFNRYGGKNGECPAKITGKAHGAPLSLKGVLYAWITPGSGVAGYESFALYKSLDKGCSWTAVGLSFDRATTGISFGSFVQFGKDNTAAIDTNVYSVATAILDTSSLEKVQRPGRVMLLRVPAASIEVKGAYQFFAGSDANGLPTWSTTPSKAIAIYEDAAGVGPFSEMSYVPGLGRLVYTNQHGNGSDTSGMRSLLTIAEAPRPWGPWTVFYRQRFFPQIEQSVFQWTFAPKWFRNGGGGFTLIFSGTGSNDSWNTVDGEFTTSP